MTTREQLDRRERRRPQLRSSEPSEFTFRCRCWDPCAVDCGCALYMVRSATCGLGRGAARGLFLVLFLSLQGRCLLRRRPSNPAALCLRVLLLLTGATWSVLEDVLRTRTAPAGSGALALAGAGHPLLLLYAE